jgi:hypothetical protein
VSIRYETEDVVDRHEAGEERGATALDPEAVERAQPRQRPSKSAIPIDPSHVAAAQAARRSSQLPMDTSHGAAAQAARRSSQLPSDSQVGPAGAFQRPRGKRHRGGAEIDRNPTQTFGPADPLPPSPVAREQSDGWFRPSLRTESIPDLSALTGDTGRTSYDYNLANSPGAGITEESGKMMAAPARRPLLDLQARPWLFPLLLAATCLAVGMVLGALLFGNRGAGQVQNERDQVVIRCSDPPARRALSERARARPRRRDRAGPRCSWRCRSPTCAAWHRGRSA